jgi:hypothetical protein
MDVSTSAPLYFVRDVVSPFGLLRDSIPIPGDVITEMANSIVALKSNFTPRILPLPTSLTFVVDEGRGFSAPQSVQVTNNGVYGSLLNSVITVSAPYVHASPAKVGGLAINESGQFDVTVDSTTLVAASSPYSQTVTIQDPTATNSPQTVGVTINVRPKATIALSPSMLVFTVTKPPSGSFPTIPTQSFSVQNTGPSGSNLDFIVQKLLGNSDWLTGFTPSSGTLASSGSTSVVVTVAPPDNFFQGTYNETLRVSGYSTNSFQDIQIQLVIS